MAKAKNETDGKGPSHMSMVRTVLDESGMDTQPLQLQALIKAKYGVELPTQKISNYKFQIRRAAGKPGPGRGRRTAVVGASGGTLRVEDFEVLRGLIDRLGAAQVKRLVDVVS